MLSPSLLQQFATFMDRSQKWGFMLVSEDETIIYANTMAHQFFGCNAGRTHHISECFSQAMLQRFREAAGSEEISAMPPFFQECNEFDGYKHDGTPYSLRIGFEPIRDQNTRVYICAFTEITQAVEEKRYLEHRQKELMSSNEALEALVLERTKALESMLYTDRVTGLESQLALVEALERSSLPTLFMIEINDYRRYLDLYGAQIGEEIQERFSRILTAYNSEKGYRLYHIESSLFGMLHLNEYIDTQKYESDLFELMETILENPLYIPTLDETLFLDVTIGIASGENDLLNHAYDALHRAKATKKRFVYFHPFFDQSEEHRNILQVKKEIRQTIEAGGFVPLYQPITDRNGTAIKYEVLIRMRQNGQLVSPAYFLDIAAKTNQYEQISQLTLLQALDAFDQRTELVSLNFAQSDIANKELLRELEHRFKKAALAERCIFEIVESDAIEDYEVTRRFVTRFRALGVRFAIDDFGSGYANFTHIMELEPDYVKIDGSLVKEILSDNKSLVLVRSITQFAHDLGIKVIAEFVASKEIFELLLEIGVDEFQGFYFGKPDLLK